jgi:hypothetical protein
MGLAMVRRDCIVMFGDGGGRKKPLFWHTGRKPFWLRHDAVPWLRALAMVGQRKRCFLRCRLPGPLERGRLARGAAAHLRSL